MRSQKTCVIIPITQTKEDKKDSLVCLSLFLIFELYTRILQIQLPSNNFYDSVFTGNVIFVLTTWFKRICALKFKVMIHSLFEFCFWSVSHQFTAFFHISVAFLFWHLRSSRHAFKLHALARTRIWKKFHNPKNQAIPLILRFYCVYF